MPTVTANSGFIADVPAAQATSTGISPTVTVTQTVLIDTAAAEADVAGLPPSITAIQGNAVITAPVADADANGESVSVTAVFPEPEAPRPWYKKQGVYGDKPNLKASPVKGGHHIKEVFRWL